MDALGHPLTWPTSCFIGCGEPVWAHTNGTGDFVLFDSLGSPWEIHSCYLNRFCPNVEHPRRKAGEVYTDQESAIQIARQQREYREAARRASEDVNRVKPRQIVKAEPNLAVSSAPFEVIGYVQDVTERHTLKLLRHLGALGKQLAHSIIGSRESQITIVDRDSKSYTALVDIRQIVIGKRCSVVAQLRPARVLGVGDMFLCDELEVLPVRPDR